MFASSVNSNIQTSDGFVKCEGTCWWAMYWGNLMILTPVKHSRVMKFSLTTNMNDTGFCSVGLQTVCSYMQKKRRELFSFLVPPPPFLVWYCLKRSSACKVGVIKCLTETVNFLFCLHSFCCCHTHRWHFIHLFVISPYFCDFIFYVMCTVDVNYCCWFNALIITLTVRQGYFLWDLKSLQPCCLDLGLLAYGGVSRTVCPWRWRR